MKDIHVNLSGFSGRRLSARAATAAPSEGWLGRVRGPVSRVADMVREMRNRARERRQLLAMTDRDLRDIGVSRLDARREANKPIWRR